MTPFATNNHTNKQDPRAAARLISKKMPLIIARLLEHFDGDLGRAMIDDNPITRTALEAGIELGRVLLSPEAWVRCGDD